MREAKQVIVVRKDLGMRKGKIAAQAAHASLGAVLKLFTREDVGKHFSLNAVFSGKSPEHAWLDGPFTKICVSVDSEKELLDLVEEARRKGILHCLITDSGRTEFNNVPTITCAAFGPWWVDELNRLTGHLTLL